MNTEEMILEKLQKIETSLNEVSEKQAKIEADLNRLIAWVEKVLERFQNPFGNVKE